MLGAATGAGYSPKGGLSRDGYSFGIGSLLVVADVAGSVGNDIMRPRVRTRMEGSLWGRPRRRAGYRKSRMSL